ncbi:MAG: HEPN domain-containing protein [Desulfobacterium sp.]
MNKNDIKSSTELFLYKATVDINAAKYLLKAFENNEIDIDLETIMFHLQQCAEKLLKSILSQNKVRVLKTHDIDALIELAHDNSIELIQNIELLKYLSDFAVDGRYAVIHDDLDDADKYIEVLDRLLEFIQKKVINDK